jgi:hypothetical protein
MAPAAGPGRARLDLSALGSEQEMEAAFLALEVEEAAVGEELASVLDRQVRLDTRLRGVLAMAPRLREVAGDSEELSRLVGHTAGLAERVSAKVRQLDLAKSRVAECQQRVKDLIDLRGCSEGVSTALEEEDYEQAAAHIHRFLAMDQALLQMTGRGLEGAGYSSLETSLVTLHEAETKVRGVVSRRFAEAVKDEDLASIERFFKIFPLLGMYEEGISSFTGYLCGKLVENSKKNLKAALDTPAGGARANVILADTLTLLFEGVARIVEIHQPLIETYYGPGRLPTVLSRIQQDCDTQAGNIFAEFRKRRGIRDKVSRVEGQPRVSAREVEPVLGEMCLLQNRVEMYSRFVRKRCGQDIETSETEAEARGRRVAGVEAALAGSGLARVAQESLGEYIALEQHFMAENLKLAISLDCMEADQLTTSMLDDVFFIVKKCIGRATTTQNVDGICAVINNAVTLLESDFLRVFQDTVKAGLPSTYLDTAYSVLQSTAVTAKLAGPVDAVDKQRQLFLAYLNNAESGAEYITRLQRTVTGDLEGLQHGAANQSDKISSCLAGLSAVQGKLRAVLESGLGALRTGAVRPRIKPWIDAFCSVNHNIAEAQFAEYSANDPWVQQTIVNLDTLVQSFRAGLTTDNFER